MEAQTDVTEAAQKRGLDDYIRGWGLGGVPCPYEPGSPDAEAWQKGYDEGPGAVAW